MNKVIQIIIKDIPTSYCPEDKDKIIYEEDEDGFIEVARKRKQDQISSNRGRDKPKANDCNESPPIEPPRNKPTKQSRPDPVRENQSQKSPSAKSKLLSQTKSKLLSQTVRAGGTNSLRSTASPACADKIIDIGRSTKNNHPDTKVTLSTLVARNDDDVLTEKVNEENNIIRKHCRENNRALIEHDKIIPKHQNRTGLHLNKSCTALLAKNFISHIRSN